MEVQTVIRRRAAALIHERGGVDTGGRLHLPVHDAEHILYVPGSRGAFRRALPTADVTDQDVFLDAGSGKGRLLLEAASHYRFKRVVGVELITELHETAQKNVEMSGANLHCPVELVNSDIVDYVIPDDVTVIYLNNPFRGKPFRVFMRNLSASLVRCRRPLTVIYENPTELKVFLGSGLFEVTNVLPLSRRKLDTYPFGWTIVAKT